MSWESSLEYYRFINEKTKELLGGFHSSQCLMYSVDFAEIVELQHNGQWEALDEIMVFAARKLEAAGADILVLCTNTMHLCTPAIRAAITIPFLHIAEATGEAIVSQGLQKVALLGTRFTMEKDFYKKTLLEKFGIETIIPSEGDREKVHHVIYQELVKGQILDASREVFKTIIGRLQGEGAQGVILGCTEIPLLISAQDVEIPVFDTTRIHAEKAVEMALG